MNLFPKTSLYNSILLVLVTLTVFKPFVTISSGQEGWIRQESNANNNLIGISYSTPDTGFAIGENGTLLYTINRGIIWNKIDLSTDAWFYEIAFTNPRKGIIIGGRFGSYGVVYHTLNGGVNWEKKHSTAPMLYAADYTEDIITIGGYLGLLQRSFDNGETWISLPPAISDVIQYSQIFFLNRDIGTVLGWENIARTVNGGSNWTEQSFGSEARISDIYFINADTGMAVGGDGVILITTDGGYTWKEQFSSTAEILRSIVMISPDTAYAVGDNGVILRTVDQGSNWVHQDSRTTNSLNDLFAIDGKNLTIVGNGGLILQTRNGGFLPIPSSPVRLYPENKTHNIFTAPKLVWNFHPHAAYYHIQVSSDTTFSQCLVDQIMVNDTTLILSELNYNTSYYWRLRAGNSSGKSDWTSPAWKFTTEECQAQGSVTWQRLGFSEGENIHTLLADSLGGLFAVVNTNRDMPYYFYHSTNNGDSWIYKGELIGPYDNFLINANDYIFCLQPLYIYGRIIRSNSSSFSWDTILEAGRGYFLRMIMNRLGHLFYEYYEGVGGTSYIGYSSSNGDNWNSFGLPDSLVWGGLLAINEQSHIFIRKSLFPSTIKIYRTLDYGESWETLLTMEDEINCLDLNNQGDIFAGTNQNGVLRSLDDGSSWENFGPDSVSIISFLISRDDSLVAITQEDGTYFSNDNGLNWFERNEGLTDFQIRSATIDINGTVFVATPSGLFRNLSIATEIPSPKSSPPSQYKLYQNYPNPFNSSTTFSFSLNKSGLIKISIYNIRGQMVKILSESYYSPGHHKITWNASLLSSGLYFYQIEVNGLREVKKCILIR
jgi:photosystem II stability/assembly factor-like uncharacterized protein